MSQQVTPYPPNTLMYTEYPIVHLVRHGPIPNYQTDQPLTTEGRQKVLAIGRELASQIRPGETISFYSSPTRRTRQTAELLREGLQKALSQMKQNATIIPIVTVADNLQNLQFYLDGLSYDPIQPLFEVARWRLQQANLPQYQASVAFQAEFWASSDPMAYWLTHLSPTVESPQSVATRTQTYIKECLARNAQTNGPRRDICVTHSANLRAFLQSILGDDPGEPEFCGMAIISEGRVYYRGEVGEF